MAEPETYGAPQPEAGDAFEFDIIGSLPKWFNAASNPSADTCVRTSLSAAGFDPVAPVELALSFVSEAESAALNKTYRDKDRPTNVLSFPGCDPQALDQAAEAARSGGPPVHLGDIVICAAVVSAEAAQQGKTPANHLRHLLVHGTLHLLGYDHQSPAEAAVMEALERGILARWQIADPYDLQAETA